MRVTKRGQITIPKAMRDELGISGGSEVELQLTHDAVLIRKVARPTPGTHLVDRMRGRGDVDLTTEEIMALTRAG